MVYDFSFNLEMIFSYSEMIKVGYVVGLCLYSIGIIIYGVDGDFKVVINNLEDVCLVLCCIKVYGVFSVKSYNQLCCE